MIVDLTRNDDGDNTVIVHKHYRVTRANSRDAMVLAGMTRGDWSERVAVSRRRNVEATSGIAEDLKKGGALVLARHETPIGMLIHVPVKGAAWEIRRLGMVTTYAGRGFTQLLMQALEGSARRQNIQAIRVAVEARKDNVRRYFEDQGFRVVSANSLLTQFPSASRPVTLQKYLMM
jgi:GNAT superfamily N-acetyltransferase